MPELQPNVGSGGDPLQDKLLGLQARLASEQKARANLQRKLQNLGEMHQALEDYKVHLSSTEKAKADAEQRLQDIKPELERRPPPPTRYTEASLCPVVDVLFPLGKDKPEKMPSGGSARSDNS